MCLVLHKHSYKAQLQFFSKPTSNKSIKLPPNRHIPPHKTTMSTSLRLLPRAAIRSLQQVRRTPTLRTFTSTATLPSESSRSPPSPPDAEAEALSHGNSAPTFLGTTKRLPEFNLVDKVVLVSGAAQGLGLVQAEALLEAGAIGLWLLPNLLCKLSFGNGKCQLRIETNCGTSICS